MATNSHPGTISTLRYLKRSDLVPEQQIIKNWFREICHSYGTDVTYFRHDARFIVPSVSANNCDNTYGEKPTLSYTVSTPMIILTDIKQDNILLSKFGFQTNGEGECYIVKDDFFETMRDIIGQNLSATFNTSTSATVENFSGLYDVDLIAYGLSGHTSGVFVATSGYNDVDLSGLFTRYPKKQMELVYGTDSYTDQIVSGNLSVSLTGTVDVSGNGYLYGNTTGTLSYCVDTSGYSNNKWEIAPQVGDIYRMDMDEFNHQEYEITQVHDSDVSMAGINPLLNRYLWKCSIVRRQPSHETMVGTSQNEEQHSEMVQTNPTVETVSNIIFDYAQQDVDTIDTRNSDDVYGGY